VNSIINCYEVWRVVYSCVSVAFGWLKCLLASTPLWCKLRMYILWIIWWDKEKRLVTSRHYLDNGDYCSVWGKM